MTGRSSTRSCCAPATCRSWPTSGCSPPGDLPPLDDDHGCPALDDGFQTSVPGLYATSFLATAHFGPFFGFTLAARMSAVVLARAVVSRAGRAGYAVRGG